jgi:hypothetical protein
MKIRNHKNDQWIGATNGKLNQIRLRSRSRQRIGLDEGLVDRAISTNETTLCVSEPADAQSGWHLLLHGLEVRLRFVFALALLAGLMAGWPWLRGGWERLSSRWHRHAASAAVSGDTEFFCPMDPGVLSAWPAICPICNMDLIPRKKVDAVLLPEGVVARMQFSPYRVQLAGIRTVTLEGQAVSAQNGSTSTLNVPASAVVNHGSTTIVYLERMPGMFDGVAVTLGPRDGDCYPVLDGLQSGQRVAVAGAFLIDAESRLNPNLATQYFGANAQTSASRMPVLSKRNSKTSPMPLSDEDRVLVEKQRICPVTEAPLGSMGQPTSIIVQGRKVFLCCRGCESAMLKDPNKYLSILASILTNETP